MSTRWHQLLFALMVVVLAVQPLGAFAANPSPDAPRPAPMDLATDENRDGLPDELVAALAGVEALDAQVHAGEADEGQVEAAMLDFYARLPSQKTRAMQVQLAGYVERLSSVNSQEESEALAAELGAIQARMLRDPAYVTVKQSMEALALKRLDALVGMSQASNQLFLPAVGTGKTPSDAGPGVNPSAGLVGGLPPFETWVCEPEWEKLQPGDIVFVRGPEERPIWALLRLFTLVFEHAGTVAIPPEATSWWVLDSKFDLAVPQVGVAAHELKIPVWVQEGDKVALAHIYPAEDVPPALMTGISKIGAPYNFNVLNKWSTDKFYCAQLLYFMYRSLTDPFTPFNLDSNSRIYALYMIGVWGWPLGWYIADKSIGVDEIWLEREPGTHVEIYSLGTVGGIPCTVPGP